MGKKSKRKQNNSEKPKQKTNLERIHDVKEIKNNMDISNLSNLPQIVQFYNTILKDYMINGKSASGKISIVGREHEFYYILTNKPNKKCITSLKYVKGL